MSDLSLIEPHELDPISFVLGHGETLVGRRQSGGWASIYCSSSRKGWRGNVRGL